MMSGPLVGPAVGGMLADSIGWQWGFFVNVPIVTVCALMTARLFLKHESPTAKLPIDVVGLGLMIIWVGAVQIVLDHGRQLEWFSSPLIIALSIVSAIAFFAFLIWELTETHPIVDLSVFRYRSFCVASIITAIGFATATGSGLVVYVWLQTGLNYDATTAGYVSAITGAPGLLVGPLVAYLTRRLDIRTLASIGLSLTAAGMFLRTQFIDQIDFFHVIMPQLFIGVAGAFFWGPLIAIAMTEVPQEKISSAAGMLTFTRTLVFAMTIALLTTFWETGTKESHAELSSVLNEPMSTLSTLETAGITAQQSTFILNSMVDNQSVIIALHQISWFLGLLISVGAFAIWLAPGARSRGTIQVAVEP